MLNSSYLVRVKCDVRLPAGFRQYAAEPVVSNFDMAVDWDMADALQHRPFYANFAAWAFKGLIWWDDRLCCWAVEVWVSGKYTGSYFADHLQSLIREVNTTYGQNEVPYF